VISGVEDLDESCMLLLNFVPAGGSYKLSVGQMKLDGELGLNKILPCLSLFDLTRLNLQGGAGIVGYIAARVPVSIHEHKIAFRIVISHSKEQ
jgi:hypothetical protein